MGWEPKQRLFLMIVLGVSLGGLEPSPEWKLSTGLLKRGDPGRELPQPSVSFGVLLIFIASEHTCGNGAWSSTSRGGSPGVELGPRLAFWPWLFLCELAKGFLIPP